VAKDDQIETEESGSGGDSIDGYEYQIDVSVWLALDLVLANNLTPELVLEPASEEDVEADLEEFEPGRVTSVAPMTGYRLVVQAKLRSGDAWTVEGIKALLKHGGQGRASAASRLAGGAVRYLLVTSAGVNGGVRKLRVRNAGVWPKAGDMPPSIAKSVPGSSGRVAVIANQDPERLVTDIKRLLTENFRVAHARWEACRKALREAARARISKAGSGRWKREELERVIRDHGGYLASTPELEHYVYPTNWSDLLAAMRARHAALIIGQSGTGKTMATKQLYEALRQEIPGLERVPITLGPQQLRDDRTPPPVLYDIEDPWGRFDFDPGSRPWNDQLAQFFGHAAHDRMIVATTRRDVAQSAGVLDTVKPWMVPLESEHYGPSQRRALYKTRIASLPRDLQLLAQEYARTVLSELATPLEIQKFFDALRTLDRVGLKNAPGFIRSAIAQAHQDSIVRTVIEQIEERDDVRAAAVIWALLKANDKLSLSNLRVIEEELADRMRELEDGVSPLVFFFVAARNLRQTDLPLVSYYHPRVEAGIEQTLKRHVLIVRKTLRVLIDVLVSPDGPGPAWGLPAAVALIAGAERLEDLKPTPSVAAQALIDAWLAEQLAVPTADLEATLRLAAAAGSAQSNPAEVARYLLHRADRGDGWALMPAWGSPERDEAWYEHIRLDQATKPLIEAFIRKVLPRDRDEYGEDFATDAERLARDLSAAFLDAAREAVYFGVSRTSDAIVAGALSDLDGFASIIDLAVEVLTPSDEDLRRAAETNLAVINDYYSDDYAQHLADNEDGYTAHEFVQAYVKRLRNERGWRAVAQHPQQTHLRSYWLRLLADDPQAPSDEIAGAFAAAIGTPDEDDIWNALNINWDGRYEDALIRRVVDGGGTDRAGHAALICLIERDEHLVRAAIDTLLARDDEPRLAEIALALGGMRERLTRRAGATRRDAAVAALAMLPPEFAQIGEAAFTLDEEARPVLDEPARNLVATVGAPSQAFRRFRVALDREIALPVAQDDIRWLLAHSEDDTAAIEAIEAAVRRGMTAEIEAAVHHRYAHVAARALRALAPTLTMPLAPDLLALADVPGSPVRRALVEILAAHPHPAHLPALMTLVADTWAPQQSYDPNDDDYPIAQAAVPAIGALAPLEQTVVDRLYGIALGSSDPTLRRAIFALLVKVAGTGVERELFELAVSPGRRSVREAAVGALVTNYKTIAPQVISAITPSLLTSRFEPIATSLAVLLAIRGEPKAVDAAAQALAVNPGRRVLLVLFVWILVERDRDWAERTAQLLPTDHVAVQWVLGARTQVLADGGLDDLGDAAMVAQVTPYLSVKTAK
jgi:hypothetical protein